MGEIKTIGCDCERIFELKSHLVIIIENILSIMHVNNLLYVFKKKKYLYLVKSSFLLTF